MSAVPSLPVVHHAPTTTARDAEWHRAARTAVWLSWVSLFYMAIEGGVGVWQGYAAGSIALVGWGLASFIEGLASAVIVWRFTGSRKSSDTAEARAQRLVALQFFILAPYVAIESLRTLANGGHPHTTLLGMALTASSVVLMPHALSLPRSDARFAESRHAESSRADSLRVPGGRSLSRPPRRSLTKRNEFGRSHRGFGAGQDCFKLSPEVGDGNARGERPGAHAGDERLEVSKPRLPCNEVAAAQLDQSPAFDEFRLGSAVARP